MATDLDTVKLENISDQGKQLLFLISKSAKTTDDLISFFEKRGFAPSCVLDECYKLELMGYIQLCAIETSKGETFLVSLTKKGKILSDQDKFYEQKEILKNRSSLWPLYSKIKSLDAGSKNLKLPIPIIIMLIVSLLLICVLFFLKSQININR